jgi:hypothetical protein
VNDGNSNLLSQLRDIHAAADPGWWPPAPGWWLLAALLAFLLAVALRFASRKWLVARRRRKLFAALDAIAADVDPVKDPHEYLARINRLFRVVALRAFPGTASVRLQGVEWVGFIQSLLPDNARSESLSALASGPYEQRPQFDARGLSALARTWVAKYG